MNTLAEENPGRDVQKRLMDVAMDSTLALIDSFGNVNIMEAMDKLLESTYQLPHTMEEFLSNPPLLLLMSILSLIVCLVLLVLSLRRGRKAKKSSNPTPRVPPPLTIPSAEAADRPSHPKATESVNTEVDLDDFMNRIFGSGVVIRRHKPDGVKTRCLKFNDVCDLCIFKQFKRRSSIVQPAGGPYMKIPLRELKDCFFCEGSQPQTFMLEFKSKSLQLAAEVALDNAYLVEGFRALSVKMKLDPQFLDMWTRRFQHRIANSKALRRTASGRMSSFFLFSSPTKSSVHDDDDMHSVTTINTLVSR